MKEKTGKMIKTISLDNKPVLIEHINKQENFSNYVQLLIEQDIQRLKHAVQQPEEIIELTKEEKTVYGMCLRYFREFGMMKFGWHYREFSLQPEVDTLWCLLGDVRDTLEPHKNCINTYQYVLKLKEDDELYQAFYIKISKYWRQEHPIPEGWKREVIPGLTLHDALSKIIPEGMHLKNNGSSLTTRRISEILGLTYQQTYLELMPHVKPVLHELDIEV